MILSDLIYKCHIIIQPATGLHNSLVLSVVYIVHLTFKLKIRLIGRLLKRIGQLKLLNLRLFLLTIVKYHKMWCRYLYQSSAIDVLALFCSFFLVAEHI